MGGMLPQNEAYILFGLGFEARLHGQIEIAPFRIVGEDDGGLGHVAAVTLRVLHRKSNFSLLPGRDDFVKVAGGATSTRRHGKNLQILRPFVLERKGISERGSRLNHTKVVGRFINAQSGTPIRFFLSSRQCRGKKKRRDPQEQPDLSHAILYFRLLRPKNALLAEWTLNHERKLSDSTRRCYPNSNRHVNSFNRTFGARRPNTIDFLKEIDIIKRTRFNLVVPGVSGRGSSGLTRSDTSGG